METERDRPADEKDQKALLATALEALENIEPTREMIEAGVYVMVRFGFDDGLVQSSLVEGAVSEVFFAMLQHVPRS